MLLLYEIRKALKIKPTLKKIEKYLAEQTGITHIITLYPKAAIHGHECIVEFTPFTILLSSFFTEDIPHWDGKSTYEVLMDADVLSVLDVVLGIDFVSETLFEIVVDSSDFVFASSDPNWNFSL